MLFHLSTFSSLKSALSGLIRDITSETHLKVFLRFGLWSNSRNGRIRRPTLVNGHVMGAIAKWVVSFGLNIKTLYEDIEEI